MADLRAATASFYGPDIAIIFHTGPHVDAHVLAIIKRICNHIIRSCVPVQFASRSQHVLFSSMSFGVDNNLHDSFMKLENYTVFVLHRGSVCA